MSKDFCGLHIEFDRGEEVIIDSADITGLVTDFFIDTFGETIRYGVVFKRGSVWTSNRGYDANFIWLDGSDLRKINPKQPSLWKQLINFLSGKWAH
jgi:hypothetical protein